MLNVPPPPAVTVTISASLHIYRIEFLWRDQEYLLTVPAASLDDVFAVIEAQYPGCKIHWCRVISLTDQQPQAPTVYTWVADLAMLDGTKKYGVTLKLITSDLATAQVAYNARYRGCSFLSIKML